MNLQTNKSIEKMGMEPWTTTGLQKVQEAHATAWATQVSRSNKVKQKLITIPLGDDLVVTGGMDDVMDLEDNDAEDKVNKSTLADVMLPAPQPGIKLKKRAY